MVANITSYIRNAVLACRYKLAKCWEGLEEIRLQSISVRIVDQSSGQKSEENLPKGSVIIKDGSGGKYHKLHQKRSSCLQMQVGEMLGRAGRNSTAERKCQNCRSAKLEKE